MDAMEWRLQDERMPSVSDLWCTSHGKADWGTESGRAVHLLCGCFEFGDNGVVLEYSVSSVWFVPDRACVPSCWVAFRLCVQHTTVVSVLTG